MPKKQIESFQLANEMWFRKGYSRRALKLYNTALEQSPNNPVILYQMARVLWSLDLVTEARSYTAQAVQQSSQLGNTGQSLLQEWESEVTRLPPRREIPELQGRELDIEQLAGLELLPDVWYDVALAADDREMYGVAVEALQRAKGSWIDIDYMKDFHNTDIRRRREWSLLVEMWSELK